MLLGGSPHLTWTHTVKMKIEILKISLEYVRLILLLVNWFCWFNLISIKEQYSKRFTGCKSEWSEDCYYGSWSAKFTTELLKPPSILKCYLDDYESIFYKSKVLQYPTNVKNGIKNSYNTFNHCVLLKKDIVLIMQCSKKIKFRSCKFHLIYMYI